MSDRGEITDGAGKGPVDVKNPGISPTAADKALVVALSPNGASQPPLTDEYGRAWVPMSEATGQLILSTLQAMLALETDQFGGLR